MLDPMVDLSLAWGLRQSFVGRRTWYGLGHTVAGVAVASVDFVSALPHPGDTHHRPRLCTSRQAFRTAGVVGTVAEMRWGLLGE